MTIEQAKEAIYTSFDNDNKDIDMHIATLKRVLADSGLKEAVFQPSRLPLNNREGRKLMQSYFKKRGVMVSFEE